MPRGPAPGWKRRMEPVVDDWIIASVNAAGGIGKHDPLTGHYGDLHIKGLASRDEAMEWRRALFRCAHYMHRTGQAPVSMSARIIKHAGKCTEQNCAFHIEFRAVDKTTAKAHVLARYGPDRSKWPYDPRRRNN